MEFIKKRINWICCLFIPFLYFISQLITVEVFEKYVEMKNNEYAQLYDKGFLNIMVMTGLYEYNSKIWITIVVLFFIYLFINLLLIFKAKPEKKVSTIIGSTIILILVLLNGRTLSRWA